MSAARSGQITVTTAGTAVQGPDEPGGEYYFIPDPDNSGTYVILGNNGSGDVDNNNGFILYAGPPPTCIKVRVASLKDLWFDVSANGDKICWLKVW